MTKNKLIGLINEMMIEIEFHTNVIVRKTETLNAFLTDLEELLEEEDD